MILDLGALSAADAYFTLTQTIMPRPVAWVLTDNDDQTLNIAPFSFFNAIASDPPLLMFSVGIQPDGGAKDTLRNITMRPNFTVNIASVSQLPALNASSATLPYGVSELTANNIQTREVEGFHLPVVADCKIAMQCTRYKIDTIGNRNQALIFGEITAIYLDDGCAEINEKGRLKVHADQVEPLARLGAGEYASFGDVLEAPRPD